MMMRKEYKIGEDFLLVLATFFIAAAILMRLFEASWNLGITVIYARTLLLGGIVCLLFNIALNIQELTRK